MNRRWLWWPVGLLLALGMAFALAESLGWPFLVAPLQSQLQQKLGRSLSLRAQTDSGEAPASLHFWGGIRFQSPVLEIGAPAWSKSPYLLSAQAIDIRLRYGDIWRAWRGQQLVVQTLAARQLTAYVERLADGRASWQLAAGGSAAKPPRVQNMEVLAGTLHVADAPLALTLDADLSLGSATTTVSTPSTPSTQQTPQNRVLRVAARGKYRKDAFNVSLQSTGALPWDLDTAQGTPVALKLKASVGPASLEFDGAAQDFLNLNGLDGTFRVQGPSLAAIGEPVGITLPTSPPFDASGRVQRNGARWTLGLRTARVGASQLGGDFVLDTAATPLRLTGALNGKLLMLADLAPALGAGAGTNAAHAKVFPSRPFDLAALRAMDADVQIDIQQVDANSSLLEPLRPFSAHMQLTSGLLTLTGIEARTAQGHLGGTLALDGQQDRAHWVAALNWDGVQLQRWIHQQRAAPMPPYVTGQMQGHATLQGSGRSTAEILATLQGDISATVERGTLSHLLVEMGGLDLAQSLGVFIKGDKPLVLDCALADLSVAAGTLRPRLLVLDTRDSTVWVDGSVSLATEQLDLRAVVAPKDFSLLTLRSPLHVGGSFAAPAVSVEKGPLGLKLGTALLLGLVNPLAAILPLVDAGNRTQAQNSAASCRTRMHRKLQGGLPALQR